MSRDVPCPSGGKFVITRQILLGPSRAQNLTILSSVIPEKFKGVYNSTKDHVTRATPFSGMVGHPKANTNWYSLQAHKICSEDISWGVKFQNWSRGPDHAHLGNSWSYEG